MRSCSLQMREYVSDIGGELIGMGSIRYRYMGIERMRSGSGIQDCGAVAWLAEQECRGYLQGLPSSLVLREIVFKRIV